jgi:hypothetical protein
MPAVGRRQSHRLVRARRRDRPSGFPQQRECHGMRRYTDPDRRQSGGDDAGDRFAFRQHDRQRSGPKPRSQVAGGLRPLRDDRPSCIAVLHVHDQWIVGRPVLRGEDTFHRIGVGGVSSKAVDRLSRERDEPSVADDRCRFGDGALIDVRRIYCSHLHQRQLKVS